MFVPDQSGKTAVGAGPRMAGGASLCGATRAAQQQPAGECRRSEIREPHAANSTGERQIERRRWKCKLARTHDFPLFVKRWVLHGSRTLESGHQVERSAKPNLTGKLRLIGIAEASPAPTKLAKMRLRRGRPFDEWNAHPCCATGAAEYAKLCPDSTLGARNARQKALPASSICLALDKALRRSN
jgi:hypothetical protein